MGIALCGFNSLYALNLDPLHAMKKAAKKTANAAYNRRCTNDLIDEVKHGLPAYQKSHSNTKGHIIHSHKNDLKKSHDLEKKMQLLVSCTGKDATPEKAKKLAKNQPKFSRYLSKVCHADSQFAGMFLPQCQLASQAQAYLKHKAMTKKNKDSFLSRLRGKTKNHKKTPIQHQQYDQNDIMFADQTGFDYAPQQSPFGYNNYPSMFSGQQPGFINPNNFYNPQQPMLGGQLPQFNNPMPFDNRQFNPQFNSMPVYNPQQQAAIGFNNSSAAAYAQPYYGNPQVLPQAQASYPAAPMAYGQIAQNSIAIPATVTPPAASASGAPGQIIANTPSQGIVCSCP